MLSVSAPTVVVDLTGRISKSCSYIGVFSLFLSDDSFQLASPRLFEKVEIKRTLLFLFIVAKHFCVEEPIEEEYRAVDIKQNINAMSDLQVRSLFGISSSVLDALVQYRRTKGDALFCVERSFLIHSIVRFPDQFLG